MPPFFLIFYFPSLLVKAIYSFIYTSFREHGRHVILEHIWILNDVTLSIKLKVNFQTCALP